MKEGNRSLGARQEECDSTLFPTPLSSPHACDEEHPSAAFSELFCAQNPPLDLQTARFEAERCHFCYEAPCIAACPTAIDIPLFIRQIATGNVKGAAQTIFEENIFGGSCARVCPTDVLCEGACVRTKLDKPVAIGALQRVATEAVLLSFFAEEAEGATRESAASPRKEHFRMQRAPESGRHVAIVGGGPAGLTCAHHLARLGHHVTLFESRETLGGLNSYGIAPYKLSNAFVAKENAFVCSVEGIDFRMAHRLGRDVTLTHLQKTYDAVFLGIGLAESLQLELDSTARERLIQATTFIAQIRHAEEGGKLPSIGQRVLVVGGGMTSIDAAVQARALGAEEVTVITRGALDKMRVSPSERQLALLAGVRFLPWTRLIRLDQAEGNAESCVHAHLAVSGLSASDPPLHVMPVDTVLVAIGQGLAREDLVVRGSPLVLQEGRLWVNNFYQTSVPKIWAGGDCVAEGAALTVTAVAQGKKAALSIHSFLCAEVANKGEAFGEKAYHSWPI